MTGSHQPSNPVPRSRALTKPRGPETPPATPLPAPAQLHQQVRLGQAKPITPGMYLYHRTPGTYTGPQDLLIEDRHIQLIPVIRDHDGNLLGLMRTFDARTLVEPVAVPIDHIEGLWSPGLLLTVDHPDYPDAYRSIDY